MANYYLFFYEFTFVKRQLWDRLAAIVHTLPWRHDFCCIFLCHLLLTEPYAAAAGGGTYGDRLLGACLILHV
jgi:hypothetical protein